MKKNNGTTSMAATAFSHKYDKGGVNVSISDEPDFDEPIFNIFTEDEIDGMSFAELGERAMWLALKGQRTTARRVLDNDLHTKVIQERLKIERSAAYTRAIAERSFAAIDADA